MNWLKQSTAATVKLGPFVDDGDGKTVETGLTISQADIRISKNGGDFAQTNNSAGATHDENGYYGIPLDTTDTGTLGRLRVAVLESGALPVWQDFIVLPANVYDSMVLGTDNLDVTPLAADVRTAVGLASANLDTQLGAIDDYVDDLESRLTAARAGYLDKLNVTGTLAHSDAAATYKADVSALALEATLTAIKGAGWTVETLKAIADAIGALNDPTPQQVWEYATRSLSTPNDYKADVSGLLTAVAYTAPDNAGITAIKAKTDNLPASPAPASEYDTDITQIIELLYSIMGGEGWTDETLPSCQTDRLYMGSRRCTWTARYQRPTAVCSRSLRMW